MDSSEGDIWLVVEMSFCRMLNKDRPTTMAETRKPSRNILLSLSSLSAWKFKPTFKEYNRLLLKFLLLKRATEGVYIEWSRDLSPPFSSGAHVLLKTSN